VHAVGEVLPGAGHVTDVRLCPQPALGAHLARHAGHLGGEAAQLIHGGVHRLRQLENLALGLHGDLLGEVAVGDGGRDLGDVAHLEGQIARELVHAVGQLLPDARDATHVGVCTELAFGADLPRHADDLGGEAAQLLHRGVDGVHDLEDLAPGLHGDLLRQVAVGNGGGDAGDVAQLPGEGGGEEVDVVDQVAPRPRQVLAAGLNAQLS